MGAAGQKEQVSEAKRRANAANARLPRLGARKAADQSEEVRLRRALRAIRMATLAAVDVLVELAAHAKDEAVRVRAAAEILSRGGVPPRTEAAIAMMEVREKPPKLFAIDTGRFQPPPSWGQPSPEDTIDFSGGTRALPPHDDVGEPVVQDAVLVKVGDEVPEVEQMPPRDEEPEPEPMVEEPVEYVEYVETTTPSGEPAEEVEMPKKVKAPDCPRCGRSDECMFEELPDGTRRWRCWNCGRRWRERA